MSDDTLESLARELANERLNKAKLVSYHDEEASFGCTDTLQKFLPAAREFVQRCRNVKA